MKDFNRFSMVAVSGSLALSLLSGCAANSPDNAFKGTLLSPTFPTEPVKTHSVAHTADKLKATLQQLPIQAKSEIEAHVSKKTSAAEMYKAKDLGQTLVHYQATNSVSMALSDAFKAKSDACLRNVILSETDKAIKSAVNKTYGPKSDSVYSASPSPFALMDQGKSIVPLRHNDIFVTTWERAVSECRLKRNDETKNKIQTGWDTAEKAISSVKFNLYGI